MVVTYQNRAINNACAQAMQSCLSSGNDIIWMAFPPGGNDKYAICTKNGQVLRNGLSSGAEGDITLLSQNQGKITRIAFTASGQYCMVNENGARRYSTSLPQDFKNSIENLASASAITHVSFAPNGGWFVANALGTTDQGGLSTGFITKLNSLKKNGAAKIISVTFPLEGGDTWCIVNNLGDYYLQASQGEETLMWMRYFSEVSGPVQHAVFDTDGNGWSVIAAVTKNETVWDGTNHVSILEIYQNVANRLDGNCTGYQVSVGRQSIGSYAHGYARTSVDSPERLMFPWTKIQCASVGKLISGLATIRVLNENKIAYTAPIGPNLPKSWKVDPAFQNVTYAELLTHTSGFKLGDGPQEYSDYQTMFESAVVPGKPSKWFNPADKSYAYSNYNFGILRILLPLIEGEKDDAAALANHFIATVQRKVFDPVGVSAIAAKQPTPVTAYGLAYQYFGSGSSSGADPGDWTLSVGEAGFYVSVDDMAKVMNSLSRKDGAILNGNEVGDWEKNSFGLDRTANDGYRWLEKKGEQSWNNRTISTSVQILGPHLGIFGALFINSNTTSLPSQANWAQCKNCNCLVYTAGETKGKCPAGNTHDTVPASDESLGLWQGSNVLNNDVVNTQMNWRYCNKCQAVHFAGGSSIGPCSAGGKHETQGSGNYGLPIRMKGYRTLGEYLVGWSSCKFCSCMVYKSSPAKPCSGGTTHLLSDDGFNYMIPRTSAMNSRWVLWDAYANALKP